jgi:Leucine-rich repeat (LRR) protein
LIKEFIQVGTLDDLEELNMDTNGLTAFPILKAPAVKRLMLNGNPFTSIANMVMSKLDSLEELRFDKCQLNDSPFPVVNLPSIKSLYITESQLVDVSNLSNSLMPLVEDINFSINKITTMPVIKFP